jgi:hypothetical protein
MRNAEFRQQFIQHCRAAITFRFHYLKRGADILFHGQAAEDAGFLDLLFSQRYKPLLRLLPEATPEAPSDQGGNAPEHHEKGELHTPHGGAMANADQQ